MTRRTNARLAGLAFLAYFATGIPTMILDNRSSQGRGIIEQLASMALHASNLRLAALLIMLSGFCAITLGVTLWAITRDEDPDLAMFALVCRVGEGLTGILAVQRSLGILWFANASQAKTADPETTLALGAYLVNGQGAGGVGATLFAVGSLLFSWLLLRGRMIPTALAWIGVTASLLMVVGLPLQLLRVLPVSATWFMWIPMAAFELPFAMWLIFKGVDGRQALDTPSSQ